MAAAGVSDAGEGRADSTGNLQDVTINEGIEEPAAFEPVHKDVDDSTIPDVQTEGDPAVDKPAPTPVEKDVDVEVTGSQFVEPVGTSTVLSKIFPEAKPTASSKISVPDLGSLENQDFASLLQEFSQNRLHEDGIIAMLKKKYEVSSSSFIYITCSPQSSSLYLGRDLKIQTLTMN